MSIETEDDTAAAQITTSKPKGPSLDKVILILVALCAVGLMLAWLAFLAWCGLWLLSGLV